jgi:hypothetical protein
MINLMISLIKTPIRKSKTVGLDQSTQTNTATEREESLMRANKVLDDIETGIRSRAEYAAKHENEKIVTV